MYRIVVGQIIKVGPYKIACKGSNLLLGITPFDSNIRDGEPTFRALKLNLLLIQILIELEYSLSAFQ